MPSLSKELRSKLANQTLAARECAEQGALAALENLAVHEADPRRHMNAEQKGLRNRLRARGKAAGDVREANGTQGLHHLAGEAAYEHWHRLLFTRFLTENHLLRTDEANGFLPVTLAECDDLAEDVTSLKGFDDPSLIKPRNGFELACLFASQILPGVFRKDDPVLELRLAPNDEVALKTLLDELPAEVFTADDSLGWTYQFWQAKRKDEVNASGKKIGADEISPVTQLFTEDYMVSFLLDNTLGAWWAGKKGPIHAASEVDARRSVALPERDGMPALEWNYLRFVQDEETRTWRPAAGTFDGWPKHAKEITMLDPCMGSGHFLVFALPIVARLRMEEEGLSAQEAVTAALHGNIHGLELDPRCTQIGAFNVALTAWKLAGFQQLPAPHIACSGLAPQAKLADWVKLAGDNEALQSGMKRLYELFEKAPFLGSLIDPRGGGDLFDAAFDDLQPLLEKAAADDLAGETFHEMAITAKGVAVAAKLLGGRFTLVATNVPYLGRGKQHDVLKQYCQEVHKEALYDLATCFVERCLKLCALGATAVLVTPQNWLFLGKDRRLRIKLLQSYGWRMVAKLGARGFQTPMFDLNVMLLSIDRIQPSQKRIMCGLDVTGEETPEEKAVALQAQQTVSVSQHTQLSNPDARVVFSEEEHVTRLRDFADSYQGICTGDFQRFGRCFWEPAHDPAKWMYQQSTVSAGNPMDGYHYVFLWEQGSGEFHRFLNDRLGENHGAWVRGLEAWGSRGVCISQTGALYGSHYLGQAFDNNAAVIVAKDAKWLPAIWAYCSSPEYSKRVREIDQALKVTNITLLKVPFDAPHWQRIAAEKYPHGLPSPHSDDPAQWLFGGHPKGSEQPLHVALARLVNHCWPRQMGSSFLDCPALEPDGLEPFADMDGIVCLTPINNEQPAAARLRQLLGAAVGNFDERSLIAATGSSKANFEDWLRDEFFEQHCKLFHHRPFVWHIWDGRKDGFHAFVNYHQLDHANLQKLTFSYLGDWIRVQKEGVQADKPGAPERLGAAQLLEQELKKILDGEAPYDLFVRWKPISEQAIGWHPDLNDGVRLNIRPFLSVTDVGKKGAGILRWKPNIKWDKDRGTEPQRDKSDFPWFWCEEEPGTDPVGEKTFTGNRWNDVHLTLDKKRRAK